MQRLAKPKGKVAFVKCASKKFAPVFNILANETFLRERVQWEAFGMNFEREVIFARVPM